MALSSVLLLASNVKADDYDEKDTRQYEEVVPQPDEPVYLPESPYAHDKDDFIQDSHGSLYSTPSDFSRGDGYLPPSSLVHLEKLIQSLMMRSN